MWGGTYSAASSRRRHSQSLAQIYVGFFECEKMYKDQKLINPKYSNDIIYIFETKFSYEILSVQDPYSDVLQSCLYSIQYSQTELVA